MTDQKHESLTREEQAFLIKILWESLQAPPWSRDDLIEFGKAIFGKTPLKDLDPKKFDRLFPFLKQITDSLGTKLKEAVLPAPSPASASQGESNSQTNEPSPATPETDPTPQS